MGIKICGIGVISSIGNDCGENLKSLLDGHCGIGMAKPFESQVTVPVGAVKMTNEELKDKLCIDRQRRISRTALLGAIAAKEAITDANIEVGKRIGLISATTVGGMDLSETFYADYIDNRNGGRLRDVVGHDCSVGTDFIASCCGIGGFRTTISTACSSAINAMIMGAKMLENGMLDYVLVGGTDALCKFTINGFNSLSILDKTLCKPFDKARNGLNLGEGAGYVVLTKDEERTTSYCLLKGYGNANDAFHQTASSEDGEGAYLAMSKAIEKAGLKKGDIDYINLHGTGTHNNDSSEGRAIVRLFGEEVPKCSSTKGYTGHALAAAGGLETVFCVLAMQNKVIYPNLRFETEIEGGIRPEQSLKRDVRLRYVMTNSFGFGGNCSSLILGEK